MNTNNLKRFAKEARIKLLDQVGRKLEFVLTHDTAELRGKQKEIEQLKKKIAEQGKEHVIEMVAYTWFNRLMALRFMDANGYTIPKVITPLEGMTNPEVLQNAMGGNIEPELKLDRQRLNDLLDGKTAATDAHTEAYKMLLVASCNQWHTAMPFMFERISDYTELLLPDDLLSDYSIVADIRNGMSDEDCQQEELIGWLYQFYIADKKDEVFEGLKKNIKITAENIPAATQLFTPRWIVRYMVENTLGKLWLTLKPNSKLRQFMPYYIEAPEGNAPAPLPEGIKGVTDITFLDPCQGSGHVLVYAFDLFTKIYEEEGYNTNEIPALILEHNLFGIDIDERAAQLAAFALTMKARSYYPRFLRKPVQPHVIALENVNEDIIKQAVKLPLQVAGKLIYDYRDLTLYNLTQADNFGSLIQIDPEELKALQIQKGSIWQEQEQKLKEQAEYLSRQYHCVVTNPPYLSSVGMNKILKTFTELKYPKSKTDLMACFMERCIFFSSLYGLIGMINQHSWMFLSSYVDLRTQIIDNIQFETLLHLGPKTFPEIGGEVVQNAAFTFGNYAPNSKGCYIRLIEFNNAELKEIKFKEAIDNIQCEWLYKTNQKDFELITGTPVAYWASPHILSIYKNPTIGSFAFARKGNTTTNNDKYVKLWQELNFKNVAIDYASTNEANDNNKYWIPYNKGGGYRKWYGLNSTLIFWKNNGAEIKSLPKSVIANEQFYMREGTTWGHISSHSFSGRYFGKGFIFDNAGNCLFSDEKEVLTLNAFLNSNTFQKLSEYTNPTIGFSSGEVAKIPYKMKFESRIKVESIAKTNINIAKDDWDARETSWDFQRNELLRFKINILKDAIKSYKSHWSDKFYELHTNEEELNKIFIDIYGLEDELTPYVPLEGITILQEEAKVINGELIIDPVPVIVQLLSYSIGCIFGRYSLDKLGLILANQGETLQDFLKQIPSPTFMLDEDNIIPVLDGEWFTDDIVGRFKVFLKAAFGEEHFEENLKCIEDTIGKDIRKYFVKDFYNDHIKRYKKRPIYWMFSSPKGHFKALIYMHRYQPDLCSKMLNDYLQAFISKLEAAKQTQTMLSLREDISAREKTLAIKEIDKYEAMLKDCGEYERTLFTIATQKISIDLDNGVKVNYLKFKEVLVPIKGLEKEEE
jgi:hypothetical protein